MGKMKEMCIAIMEANNGIPENITVGDVARMKQLEIYNWEEYEREQEKIRQQFYESKDTGEARKIEQVQKKFTTCFKNAHKKEGSE